jgi:hypothetical protein
MFTFSFFSPRLYQVETGGYLFSCRVSLPILSAGKPPGLPFVFVFAFVCLLLYCILGSVFASILGDTSPKTYQSSLPYFHSPSVV